MEIKDFKKKHKKKVMGSDFSICSLCDNVKDVKHLKSIEEFRNGTVQRRVIYIDIDIDWVNPLTTIKNAIDSGFNVILFAFYLNSGPTDMLLAWNSLTLDQKNEAFNYAASRNAILGFSAGGATEVPYILEPIHYATTLAQYCLQERLQVVDCDFENIQIGFTYNGVELYDWFQQFNNTLLSQLGSNAIVTHAPQAPYLATPGYASTWPGVRGGYSEIYKNNPEIAWFNIQFYNQNSYTTYSQVFTMSDPFMYPYSSLEQINNDQKGIPWNKFVYGTYLQNQDGNGVHDPNVIGNWFQTAKNQYNYDGSCMLWQWRISGSPLPEQFLQQLNSAMQKPSYLT